MIINHLNLLIQRISTYLVYSDGHRDRGAFV